MWHQFASPGFDYGNQNVEYNGACNPKNGALQFDYEDYGSTTQSSTSTKSPRSGENPEKRLAYAEDLDLLDDVLTVMTSDAMKVNVELELVSLNSLELADSAMDTTIVVFSSWTGICLLSYPYSGPYPRYTIFTNILLRRQAEMGTNVLQ